MTFITTDTIGRHTWTQWRSNVNGINIQTAVLPTTLVHEVKQVTPRAVKPKGWKPPTDYRHYGSTQCYYGIPSMAASGKNTANNTLYNIVGADSQNTVQLSLGSFDPVTQNEAILRAKERLKNQNVNYGLAFAEAGKTASLVATNAKRVADAIHAAKRGNIRDLARALGITKPPTRTARQLEAQAYKDYKQWSRTYSGRDAIDFRAKDGGNAHNLFLEYQFGVKPLLQDIDGAMQDLYEHHYKEDRKGPAKAGEPYSYCVTGSKTSKTSSTFHGTASAYGIAPATVSRYTDVQYKAFVRLDCYLDNPALATMAAAGLVNPLPIIWDVLPWSFVGDWVAPIGRYFNTLDSSVGWRFRGGSISKKIDGKVQAYYGPRANAGWDPIFVSGSGSVKAFDLERVRYTSFPYASVWHPKNPFSGTAGSTRVAKAVALVMQHFGK